MYSIFKSNNRGELIPVFNKILRKFPNKMNEDLFRQRFIEKLMSKLHLTEKESKKLYYSIRGHKVKKQTYPVLGKERFKYVSSSKPFQGGSPGLGKKK